MENSINYGRLSGEATAHWLERLINIGASNIKIAAVTAILKSERQLIAASAVVFSTIREFEITFLLNGINSTIIERFDTLTIKGLEIWISQWWSNKIPNLKGEIYVKFTCADTPKVCSLKTLLSQENIPFAIQTYITFDVEVYDFGSGISSLAGKKNLLNIRISSETEAVSSLKASLSSSQKTPPDSFDIMIHDSNTSLPISITSTYELCMGRVGNNDCYLVFFFLKHCSYSGLKFIHLQKLIFFQGDPNDNEDQIVEFTKTMGSIKGHHDLLTNCKDRLVNPIERARKWLQLNSALTMFNDEQQVAKKMLEKISNNTMPKKEYNEKSRRTIIDIVIHTALDIVNKLSNSFPREILVEENLFNEKDYTLPNTPDEIIGSGPLEYVVPEGVIILPQNFDENMEIKVDENTESGEENLKEEDLFVDIEANVKLDDCALYQLLGQMHDAMYVKVEAQGLKRKLEADPDPDLTTCRVKLNRQRVIGVLTTGHRVEVFSIKVHNTIHHKKVVEFLGKRILQVLRYEETTSRTSSFKVKDHTQLAKIQDADLSEMLLLFIAVFLNYV